MPRVPAIVKSGTVPVIFVPPIKNVCNSNPSELSILSADTQPKASDTLLWHRRLGHISIKRIIKMCSVGSFPGLPTKLTNKYFFCEDCLPKKLQPMDVIVSDVLGPFVEGFMGVEYLVFWDLASTYSEGFLLKKKDEVCLNFQCFIERMHFLTVKKLKCFQTGGGGEFTSGKFTEWLKENGITHQHSMPYEPEKNGAAERLHWTVGEMVRTALIASGLPDKFWIFAYMWGYFKNNRILNSLTGDKTPLELMFGKTRLFDQLCTFGDLSTNHTIYEVQKLASVLGVAISWGMLKAGKAGSSMSQHIMCFLNPQWRCSLIRPMIKSTPRS
ncbi:uncharacterized protein VP01_523g6 [Puccinia sorghi]|uniref:Integrase catalytic domain-containing protein n=1 Tax=Puccinia sorghi TaxID=27349 RepID=A0A0L6UKI3_9BASI|nr:uncharacterized protein VP01_523g6 [Puccinia sorghi]